MVAISNRDNRNPMQGSLGSAQPLVNTSWECGWAVAAGKPVVGVRTDFRLSASVVLTAPAGVDAAHDRLHVALAAPAHLLGISDVWIEELRVG